MSIDKELYLDKFRKAAEQLDKMLLVEKQLEHYVGAYQESVVLKLYKRRWTSNTADPINAKTRIFFSVWVDKSVLKESKIKYNIHAFKLRGLKGYSIASREFAKIFRAKFKNSHDDWNNVSVNFGPLTLMEGWDEFKDDGIENLIVNLVNNFMKIDHLIEETLEYFEK